MKIRTYQQIKDYFIYEMFYTNPMVNTKQKSRAETQKVIKEESEEKHHRKPPN